jgi:hypothetical protein
MVERITRWIKQLVVSAVVVFLGFWAVSGGVLIGSRMLRFTAVQANDRLQEVQQELLEWRTVWRP